MLFCALTATRKLLQPNASNHIEIATTYAEVLQTTATTTQKLSQPHRKVL
jgi:hypothetical protein